MPPSRVDSGPNHGQQVDVKQITARSLGPSLVEQAPGKAVASLWLDMVQLIVEVISMSWMYISVCVCIIVYMHVSALYMSVWVCMWMYLLVSHAEIVLNACMCMYVHVSVCICVYVYVCDIYTITVRRGFEGQWEQCATPGPAPYFSLHGALGGIYMSKKIVGAQLFVPQTNCNTYWYAHFILTVFSQT